MKDTFLKALEMGWRAKKLAGLKRVDEEELVSSVRTALNALGDKIITDEDIREVIKRVWNES